MGGPSASRIAAGTAVLARDDDLLRLDAFARDLSAGVRALVVAGEPGIGKSVLLRETVRVQRERGVQVLATRPGEDDLPLALTGLTDLLECAGLPLPAGAGVEEQGRALLSALRGLAAENPLLIVIDDAQWLDAASARVLRFALRRLDDEPVGVLAALRLEADTRDPLSLCALLPPGRCEVLSLAPLSLGALRRILTAHAPVISRPTLRRIHEASGGNPLHAIELAQCLGDQEQAYHSDAAPPLPGTLRAAIARRLDAIPEQITPVIEAAAVHPRATVEELAAVLPGHDVEDLLLGAEQLGVLVVDERLRVSFSHPMIVTVALERVCILRRRELHALLAEAAHCPDERARHLARCTDEPDAEAAGLIEEAAARSRAAGAVDAAADLAGHALRLTPPRAEGARHRRALEHIVMRAAAGECDRARALAEDLVASLGPGERRAQALVRWATLERDDPTAGEALLIRALEDLRDPSALRGRVLTQLARLRGTLRGDLEAGMRDASAALAIADRVDDAGLRMTALALASNLSEQAGRNAEALAARATALDAERGSPRAWAGPRSLLADRLLWRGDLRGARELLESDHAAALKAGNGRWLSLGLYNLAGVRCIEGGFRDADRMLGEAIAAGRDGEDPDAERWTLHRRALVAAWLGRLDEARESADRHLQHAGRRGEAPGVARAHAVRGMIGLSVGDPEEALIELEAALQSLDRGAHANPVAIRALPDAVEAAATAGDLRRAGELLERLRRQSADLGTPVAAALALRCEGVAALGQGDPDGAARSLADATLAFDALGLGPDAARALLASGQALLRAGRRSRAAEMLSLARERFAAMEAPIWEARAGAELDRVAPGRTRGELTPAEHRIARLVAEGLRNKEVALAMHLSVATVEGHLTRIYRKLRLRSRSELIQRVVAGELPAAGTPAGVL